MCVELKTFEDLAREYSVSGKAAYKLEFCLWFFNLSESLAGKPLSLPEIGAEWAKYQQFKKSMPPGDLARIGIVGFI